VGKVSAGDLRVGMLRTQSPLQTSNSKVEELGGLGQPSSFLDSEDGRQITRGRKGIRTIRTFKRWGIPRGP